MRLRYQTLFSLGIYNLTFLFHSHFVPTFSIRFERPRGPPDLLSWVSHKPFLFRDNCRKRFHFRPGHFSEKDGPTHKRHFDSLLTGKRPTRLTSSIVFLRSDLHSLYGREDLLSTGKQPSVNISNKEVNSLFSFLHTLPVYFVQVVGNDKLGLRKVSFVKCESYVSEQRFLVPIHPVNVATKEHGTERFPLSGRVSGQSGNDPRTRHRNEESCPKHPNVEPPSGHRNSTGTSRGRAGTLQVVHRP